MTSKEFQYEFGIQLNQLDSALSLTSDDIFYWLNKAQEELVKAKFNGLQGGKGFEQSVERVNDLRHLITRSTESTIYGGESLEGFEYDTAITPSDSLFILDSRSQVHYKYPSIEYTQASNKRTSTDFKQRIVYNRLVQNHKLYAMLNDPFNTTRVLSPISHMTGDVINVYTDKKFIVDEVFFKYIKMPREITLTVSSELPNHLHKPIIQTAVDLFLNNTRGLKQRLQRETPNVDTNQTTRVENNE